MTVTVLDNSKSSHYNSTEGLVYPESSLRLREVEQRYPYSDYATPKELSLSEAIHQPTYSGVDQLLVLDKNWVIVVFHPLDELVTQLDAESGNDFTTENDTWVASLNAGSPNYTAKTDMLAARNTHLPAARKTVDIPYGTASNYSITSADDSNYSSAQNPSTAARMYVSKGRDYEYSAPGRYLDDSTKTFPVDYYIYVYLEMPTALVDGDTYTIEFDPQGHTVDFKFDRTETVSRAIKVNQAGYLPTAGRKRAYLGAYLYGEGVLDLSHASTFYVIDAEDGTTALTSTISLLESNPTFNPVIDSGTTTGTTTSKLVDSGQNFTSTINVGARVYNTTDATEATVTAVDSDTTLSLSGHIMTSGEDYEIRYFEGDEDTTLLYGEDVYVADFTALSGSGWYYISVPGVGRSWPFWHHADVYSEVFYTCARAFYGQRAGTETTSKYTNWPRQKALMGPWWYASDHIDFPLHEESNTPTGYNDAVAIQNTIDYATKIAEVPGGWHDAADWDLRGLHITGIFDLLNAFDLYGSKLTDSQLNIPESGDGVPDILSEARHGLEFYRATQDGDGGISSDLETWIHPTIDSLSDNSFTHYDYAYSQPTRWASLAFAAAAAQYSRLVEPYDSSDASTYETAALDAYAFGSDSSNRYVSETIHTYPAYTEGTEEADYYLMHAKCQLYLLTDDEDYITDAPSVATLEGTSTTHEPYEWRFGRTDYSPWGYYSIIQAYNAGAASLSSLASTRSTWFTDDADTLLGYHDSKPYAHSVRRNFPVGFMAWGLSFPPNFSRSMAIAYEITSDADYLNAAIENMDWAFGCNPLGMSWTTGIGYSYPVDMQDELSTYDEMLDPRPGLTIYNVQGSPIYYDFRSNIWDVPDDNEAVSSITRSGTTATVTTSANHGLSINDSVSISGATQTEYNGQFTITVTSTTTFTYTVDSGATTPATGTITWAHNLVSDSAQRTPPIWRTWMCHPSLNVGQNEFTTSEMLSPMAFVSAFLMSSGWTPSDEVKNKGPRAPANLYGRWYLV